MNPCHTVKVAAVLAAFVILGCRSAREEMDSAALAAGTPDSQPYATRARAASMPSGTAIVVRLETELSSEAAGFGDAWTGTIASPVVANGMSLAPAGSRVNGIVTGVRAARSGNQAMLDLGLLSFTVGDRIYPVRATMEAIVAGSPQARNLGVIAAATPDGAVVGVGVAGAGRGRTLAAALRAGMATGVVSPPPGGQVLLAPGIAITFTTSGAVAVFP